MTNNNKISYQPTPVLLSVVGGSPQVITETLYGIYKKQEPMPEEVFVITTTFGRDQINKNNIAEQIENFRKDYGITTPITLKDENIWVITDENNQQLEDANTEEQHNDMADFIIEKVRDLTQQDVIAHTLPNIENADISETKIKATLKHQHSYNKGFKDIKITKKAKCTEVIFDKYTIHASIAGGRKSQTFFLGYAMSLFGRSHDTISHVIVDNKGERCREFFYPTPSSKVVKINDSETCDLSKINVSLAKIPLVLISKNMPKNLLKKNRSYTNTISLFQNMNEEPKITINMQAKQLDGDSSEYYYDVTFSDKTIRLNIKHMTYLLAWINIKTPRTNDDIYYLALAKLNAYAMLLSEKPYNAADIPEVLIFLKRLNDNKYSHNKSDADTKLIFGSNHENLKLDEMAEILKNRIPDELDGFFAKDSNPRKEFLALLSKELDEDDAKRYIPQEVDKDKGDKYNKKGVSKFFLQINKDNITFLNEIG